MLLLTKITDTNEPQQWFATDFLTVSKLNGSENATKHHVWVLCCWVSNSTI